MSYTDIKKRIKDVPKSSDEGITGVLYGQSGTGKTTILGTFPKVLHLDIREEGTAVLKKVKGLKTFSMRTWEDFTDMYWFLKKEDHNFETVGVDTAGGAQMLAIEQVMKRKGKRGKPGDWGTMSQQMWGEVAGMCKDMFLSYRDLKKDGINVLFLAHSKVHKPEEDNDDDTVSRVAPHIGPALSPAIVSTLNAAVDIIGETFIGEKFKTIKDKKTGKKKEERHVDYYLRVGPHSSYITKVRKPKENVLPDVIKDPTYEDLIELME